MAKKQRGFSATNCMIDSDEMVIVESTKEGDLVYDLNKIIQEWNGVTGISFSIKLNQDVEPDKTDY